MIELRDTKTSQISYARAPKRTTFWLSIVPDAIIPKFQPPLDCADNGAYMDLNAFINRKINFYPTKESKTVEDRGEERQQEK